LEASDMVHRSAGCGATLMNRIRLWNCNFLNRAYSTVTDFARLRGWSTSVPMNTAVK
jgi:hypothetical protein